MQRTHGNKDGLGLWSLHGGIRSPLIVQAGEKERPKLVNTPADIEVASELFANARIFIALIIPSITIAVAQACTIILYSLGFYIVDKKGSELEITAFGLSNFLNTAIMYDLSQPIIENSSISCALAYSKKQPDLIKATCMRGLIVFAGYNLAIFFPACFFTDKILQIFGTDAAIARQTREISIILFPLEVLRLLSEYLVAYMAAQGVDTGFGLLAVFSLLTGGSIAYYLGIEQGLGLTGWYYGRAGLELIKITVLLAFFWWRITDKKIQLKHLMAGFTEIKAFMKDVLLFSVGYCCEGAGYHISTLLVIAINDPKQLAAFTILTNILFVTENIGYGFGVTIRTKINHLLGVEKIVEAKSFFKLSIMGLLLFLPIIGLLFYLFRSAIVDFYTRNNPEIGLFVEQLVMILEATSISFLFLMPSFMAGRTTKQALLNFNVALAVLVVLQGTVGILMIRFWRPRCTHFLLLSSFSFALANALVCYKLLWMNWEHECRVSVDKNESNWRELDENPKSSDA